MAAARQAEAEARMKGIWRLIDGKLREHEAEVAEASFKQEQAAKAIATINRTIDEHKSRAIDLMRQISRLHNDINGLKITQESSAESEDAGVHAGRRRLTGRLPSLRGR